MGRGAKKNSLWQHDVATEGDEGGASGPLLDPLANMHINIQSFDIPREVSIYPDNYGIHWWTKAWFNRRKRGERAVAVTRPQAIAFIREEVTKDAWMERYFKTAMDIYHKALEQTREQIIANLRGASAGGA